MKNSSGSTEKNRIKKESKKLTKKSYVKDAIKFIKKNLTKIIKILLVVSILFIAITLVPMLSSVMEKDCEGACRDGVTLGSEISSGLMTIALIIFSGICPYIYAPVIGFIGGLLNAVSGFAFIIKGHGYFIGGLIGIVPLIINVIVVCLSAALGIYLCRMATLKSKISNASNMNFTNFMLRVYEMLNKQDKVSMLTKKKEDKINKIENKIEKVNYLHVFGITLMIVALQFVAILIQTILL